MLSSDPSICLVHPSKRQPVGVCHLCLRDRLVRLSLSGDSSSGHTLLPSSSSRSSFDSSCSKTDESNAKCVGKLGTIFSLIESDSEEGVAPIEEEEAEEQQQQEQQEQDSSIPSYLPRSKSLSQWVQQQPPRQSSSTKDAPFSRFAPDARTGQMHQAALDEGFGNLGDGFSSKGSKPANGSYHSPLVSASATPVVQHVERDHHRQQQSKNGGLSWISSLFRLRKRKKKSGQNGAVETNFFPPEAWNDDFQHHTHADRDRLWRSRSVSSGRVIKKSFTPLVAENGVSATGVEPEPRVSSLIALDMREATKVINNAAYDMEKDSKAASSYVAAGPRSSVASLMDIDRKYAAATCASPTLLQRSKSTGGWRRKIQSPSSVLTPNPTAPPAGGNEWSFYLTPLRTFNRNRSTRHAR